MARTKDQLEQYAKGIAQEIKLSDAHTKIAVAVITRDKESLKDTPVDEIVEAMAPFSDLAVGRQADYSRAMNETKQQHDAAIALYNKNKAWRDQAYPQFQAASAKADALEKKIAKYEADYGPLDETVDLGDGKTMTGSGKVVKTEDIERLRGEIGTQTKDEMAKQFLAFEVERDALQQQHWKRFKEPLSTAELLEVVAKHRNDPIAPREISLTDAHNELYGEKMREQDSAAHQAEIAAAEKRGEEKQRRASAATMGRSGAAISEESGAVFAHIAKQQKAGDKPVDVISDAEAARLFDEDFDDALAAANSSSSSGASS
jgi:hypothetical protein